MKTLVKKLVDIHETIAEQSFDVCFCKGGVIFKVLQYQYVYNIENEHICKRCFSFSSNIHFVEICYNNAFNLSKI